MGGYDSKPATIALNQLAGHASRPSSTSRWPGSLILLTLPVMVLYMFLGKYLIRGHMSRRRDRILRTHKHRRSTRLGNAHSLTLFLRCCACSALPAALAEESGLAQPGLVARVRRRSSKWTATSLRT